MKRWLILLPALACGCADVGTFLGVAPSSPFVERSFLPKHECGGGATEARLSLGDLPPIPTTEAYVMWWNTEDEIVFLHETWVEEKQSLLKQASNHGRPQGAFAFAVVGSVNVKSGSLMAAPLNGGPAALESFRKERLTHGVFYDDSGALVRYRGTWDATSSRSGRVVHVDSTLDFQVGGRQRSISFTGELDDNILADMQMSPDDAFVRLGGGLWETHAGKAASITHMCPGYKCLTVNKTWNRAALLYQQASGSYYLVITDFKPDLAAFEDQ